MHQRIGGAKRAVDVVLAGAGLILSAPLLAAAAAAVRLALGSPVLFRHERAGRGGRPFLLLKLRTMGPPRPGEEGPDHDHLRLTGLGRFLRSSSVDELPSLWNVLRGDLSLVGPRPLPTAYLTRYDERQARRHEVRPGITGWAQVHGRNRLPWPARLELDIWYVEHRSWTVDLRILVLTVVRVITRSDVSAPDRATMDEFTGAAPLPAAPHDPSGGASPPAPEG
ncbi:sugar transferase [soil metagenome]